MNRLAQILAAGRLPRISKLSLFRPWGPVNLGPGQARALARLSGHQGPVKIQQVVLQRRSFSWKRVATFTLSTSLSSTAVLWLAGLFLLGSEEEDNESSTDVALVTEQIKEAAKGDKIGVEADNRLELGGNRHDERAVRGNKEDEEEVDFIPDETPEGAWFIPLTLAKKLPRTFYTGQDPEWQAFVKFAKDTEHRKRLEDEMCSMIHAALVRDKNLQRVMGKDIRCQKFWLDFDFPSGPPPEYERLGLEWADDYVALLHRPADPWNVTRVEKALWPEAVTVSVYSTFRDLFWMQYIKARRALGFGQKEDKPNYPLSAPDSLQAQDHLNANSSNRQSTKPKTTTAGAGLTAKEQESGPAQVGLLSILPRYPEQDQGIDKGIALFKRKLARKWRPAGQMPPRGSILVHGLVAFEGPRAVCTVEVAAAYSVMENKWAAVGASLRRIQEKVQRPRGRRRIEGKG